MCPLILCSHMNNLDYSRIEVAADTARSVHLNGKKRR